MLDIWTPLDQTEVLEILDHQAQRCGEHLDAGRVVAHRSKVCPYERAEIIRLDIRPHVVARPAGKITIASDSLSYILVKRNADSRVAEIFPFLRNMESVIAINEVSEFRLRADTVRDYLTILGLTMNNLPFYFVSNTNQIATLLRESTDAAETHILERIEALFRVDPATGRIESRLTEHSYPFLGKCFKIRLPCIYDGNLAAANLRIAENGRPTIDDDQPVNIEGIKDRDAHLRYYPLDLSHELQERYESGIRVATKWVAWSARSMILERITSYLLFPLFLFTIFFAIYFGQDTPEVRGYFLMLKTSTLLTLASLVIGLAFLLVFTGRLVIFSIADYTNSLVPNSFGGLTHSIKTLSLAAARRIGVVGLMLINTLEFSFSATLALTLVSYGIFNLPGVSAFGKLDFWSTLVTVIWAVPLFGDWLIDVVASPSIRTVVKSADIPPIYMGVVGFVFSTVLVGWLAKLLAYARSEKMT